MYRSTAVFISKKRTLVNCTIGIGPPGSGWYYVDLVESRPNIHLYQDI